MKIVCTNINLPPVWNDMPLPKIGEIYDAVEENTYLVSGYSIILKTEGVTYSHYWLPSHLFVTLAEWREQQINSIFEDV